MSHLHKPIVRLQQQTVIPFTIMQHVHMPPANIVHKFCSMLVASLSSHEQLIFMPPVHRSILNVQRGTIIQFTPAGMVEGAVIPGIPTPGVAMPGIPIPVRSIIIAVDIFLTPFSDWPSVQSNQKNAEPLPATAGSFERRRLWVNSPQRWSLPDSLPILNARARLQIDRVRS
jgi:hypothetical protein